MRSHAVNATEASSSDESDASLEASMGGSARTMASSSAARSLAGLAETRSPACTARGAQWHRWA